MYGAGFTWSLARKHLVIFLTYFLVQVSYGQVILFKETFGGAGQAPWLPANWSANTPQVMTDPNTPSGGYPGASGGNNLLARNCMPEWEERIFEMSGISTLGYTGIRVGFGHRRTSCFVPPVSLEWSPDAINWYPLEDYLLPAQAGVWSWAGYFDLPAEAENRQEIFLRWQYWTEYLAGCSFHCNAFTGNYRIDDVVVEASVPLPVELLYFEARAVQSGVSLHWATATETGNDHFEIQRSSDGRYFVAVGQVPGQGTSTWRQDYAYRDAPDRPGNYYYRLRQVDEDGRYEYSPVRAVHFDTPSSRPWTVRHEPGRSEIYVAGPPGYPFEGALIWSDAQGRLLGHYRVTIDDRGNYFPLPASSSGWLFLQLAGDVEQHAFKIFNP